LTEWLVSVDRKTVTAGLIALSLLLASCTSDRMTRGVYEGIQNRNEALKTPAEKMSTPSSPAYPEYRKERDRTQDKPQE
jgi:hypothetical protein